MRLKNVISHEDSVHQVIPWIVVAGGEALLHKCIILFALPEENVRLPLGYPENFYAGQFLTSAGGVMWALGLVSVTQRSDVV